MGTKKTKEQRAEAMRKVWAETPEVMLTRANHPNYASPLRGQRIAEKARQRWADPDFKEMMRTKLSGGKGPVTVDGITYPCFSIAVEQLKTTRRALRRFLDGLSPTWTKRERPKRDESSAAVNRTTQSHEVDTL